MHARSVIVVGAGPAGAALALLLVRQGIKTILVEREPTFDRVFRGEALMPSGLTALRALGLGADLDRLPHVAVPCMELFVEAKRVVRADWPEVSGSNAAWAISQPALLALLIERAAATGLLEFRPATTLKTIEARADHVQVTVRSSSGDVKIRADLVVGADGRSSAARAAAGIKLDRIDFPGDVAWFSLPAPETQAVDPRFQAFSRGTGSVVVYPSWDGRVRVGLVLQRGDTNRGKAPLLERMAAIAGEPYATIARSAGNAIPDPVLLKVVVGRVPRWSADRLLLIGDAAHPMSPVRAQGINLALRDAIVAANHLIPGLASGTADALASAALRVEQERQPEIVTIQQLQLDTMELPTPMRSRLLRSTVLPLLRQVGVVKRMMLASEMPFRHGTTVVQLAV